MFNFRFNASSSWSIVDWASPFPSRAERDLADGVTWLGVSLSSSLALKPS